MFSFGRATKFRQLSSEDSTASSSSSSGNTQEAEECLEMKSPYQQPRFKHHEETVDNANTRSSNITNNETSQRHPWLTSNARFGDNNNNNNNTTNNTPLIITTLDNEDHNTISSNVKPTVVPSPWKRTLPSNARNNDTNNDTKNAFSSTNNFASNTKDMIGEPGLGGGFKRFQALSNKTNTIQQQQQKPKPALSRFVASASKVVATTTADDKNPVVDTTYDNGDGDLTTKRRTPLRDAANNVKNAKSAVTYLQKVSLKTSLKDRLRKIAEERLTIKQIFQQYVDSSTLHGFRYTCSGDSYYVRRFIWACLMIMGAVYFVVKLEGGIVEYFSYPFSTLSTLEYVTDTMPFPAITFCSVNQFRLDRLMRSEENPALHRLFTENRLPLLKNWTDPGFDVPGQELHDELKSVSLNIDDIFKNCDWIKRDTAHPEIKARECSSFNFTTHFSETGQICFTLNSGKEGHHELDVENFGIKFGYEAMFDFNNEHVVPYIDYTGLHVIVHDQKEQPTGKVGFLISPGFKVFVNMQREEVR